MSGITTHVLDTSRGAPAAGLDLELAREVDGGFTVIDAGPTDGDGRRTVLEATDGRVPEGTYRLRFETAAWFARQETACFRIKGKAGAAWSAPGGNCTIAPGK